VILIPYQGFFEVRISPSPLAPLPRGLILVHNLLAPLQQKQ
jgi:hypothetical protein